MYDASVAVCSGFNSISKFYCLLKDWFWLKFENLKFENLLTELLADWRFYAVVSSYRQIGVFVFGSIAIMPLAVVNPWYLSMVCI